MMTREEAEIIAWKYMHPDAVGKPSERWIDSILEGFMKGHAAGRVEADPPDLDSLT